MSDFTFSDLVKEHAPWSLSKADVAKNCGLRFHYKYVEKIKEPEPDRSEGRVGKAAHRVLELMLRGKSLQHAFSLASTDPKSKLTPEEKEALAGFNGNIEDFLRRIAKFKETQGPVKKEFVEHKFGLTMDLKPTAFFADNVFFRGVWDFGLYLDNRNLVILDHKTGKPSDSLEYHQDQLNMYAVAGKVLLPSMAGVQSALHYLRNGKIVWGTYITAQEIDEKLISWLVEHLNSSVEYLSREANPGSQCGFCGFAPKCKAYQDTLLPIE